MTKHIVTQDIGNLKGFSTDSIFTRPPNVATKAINLQRAPDGTLQIRRGYQAQIGFIGGMGISTFSDPLQNTTKTVCVGSDGFLYNKLTKQMIMYYDGQVTGVITGVSNTNPCVIHSVAHGLQTGAVVILRGINGPANLNNLQYTITVIGVDDFSLDGIDSTAFLAYVSGGIWSIAFADMRYLTFSIFTDPLYIYNNAAQSITCSILVNRAAQVNGTQTATNTLTVYFGNELAATDSIQFLSTDGVLNGRTVLSVTSTSITFDGAPVSVSSGTYINQYFEILFGKGFDVAFPFNIGNFIAQITNPSTGIYGLQIEINGLNNTPAAFLQLVEQTLIPSNTNFSMDYWYWEQVNSTISPPFPGSANPKYQNSKDFENASMAGFDDIIFIANGWDYPQKYDGQTVYRAGMPLGGRPLVADNTTFISLPFVTANTYQYASTYEQVDARQHIVEGEISEIWNYTVSAANAAADVTVTNLVSTVGNNWNTNGALAVGGVSTSYGPDANGFYYDLVALNTGFTLKIGDSAYYGDTTCAVMNASGAQTDVITLMVAAGHGVEPGDTIYFIDAASVERQRAVASKTATTITIEGDPVTVDPTMGAPYANILDYKVSLVFSDVGIVNGTQNGVTTITINAGHTLQSGTGFPVVFIDAEGNSQSRFISAVTATTVTIIGIPVNISSGALIASTALRTDAVNLQRENANPATLSDGTAGNISNAISNNLRINIYRTVQAGDFDQGSLLYLIASIPNDSIGGGTQIYIDGIPDVELVDEFSNPVPPPNPPPISKYVKAFGGQMFYAAGERGVPAFSDTVFFSTDGAENVPVDSNFTVPNVDDDITGIGVAGSTLVTTKNHSLWATTGNFLSGQIEVVQIAPGSNIGCVAHATIASVGTLMYFLHTNGVYAITENQLFPTDAQGNPIPLSKTIDVIFRQTNYLPPTKYVLQRAVAINYTKENQYLLFLPCEDVQSTIRTANSNSIILSYDYEEKNWFEWTNMNAAGGFVVIDDDLYFQERRTSSFDGNSANLYKQHRFYRLTDHADHAGPQIVEWLSSWADLGQPQVRKKFCRCILLMDRLSSLLQKNQPMMQFASYLDRQSNLKNTIATVTTVDNTRNSSWGFSPWGWNFWGGYQDTFVEINLKQGTVARSMQVGFTMSGIDQDIRLSGVQLEIIQKTENRC